MNNATTKQGEQTRKCIMQAIISYIEEHQYAPTVREIATMTGIKSTATIHHHISMLIADGKLETDAEWGTARALRVPNYKFVKAGAVDEGIQALEKQVAKKPVEMQPTDKLINGYFACPICQSVVGVDDIANKYCADCGQKLDWSD